MNENSQTIFELAEQKKFLALKPILMQMEPYDIAEALWDMPDKESLVIFRLLPKELAAETFVEFDNDRQQSWISAFSDKELKAVLDELFVDDTVDIIEEMPANIVKRILKQSDTETRKQINEILKYPDDSAGSLMTTEYVSLKKDMTVLEAFNRIKKLGIDSETIYTCYVTDAQRKLIGYVTIRMLLLSDMDKKIAEVMDENCVYVNTLDDKEDVAKKFSNYNFVAMPVVDQEQRLVGIITVDDAMDVMEEEVTEDIHLMGAVAPMEDSYLKTSVVKHWSKRIVWLIFLMVSGILTGLILTQYESVFVALPLVVAFIPRLTGTGGNCGSQSSALIIRGLALDEIEPRDILKVMLKELGIGSLAGVTLAIANIPIIWIMYGRDLPVMQVWYLCLAFGLTLIVVVVMANLLGSALPILAKKIKLDPALMSSPVISLIVDVLSVLIYFVIISLIVLPVLPV
ncbi:MAG TPA: magnesium transporter [Eubacteriales bacterium]|nr:magnesium transporter [Eubacteriales bacterium]